MTGCHVDVAAADCHSVLAIMLRAVTLHCCPFPGGGIIRLSRFLIRYERGIKCDTLTACHRKELRCSVICTEDITAVNIFATEVDSLSYDYSRFCLSREC